MSDFLPIDPNKIIEEEVVGDKHKEDKEGAEAENIKASVKEIDNESEEEEFDEEKKELFDKPKPKAPEPKVEISKKTGKPKRKMTEQQLENLKKARESSKARRGKVKEARELEKARKKMDIELRKQKKLDKELEQDTSIALRQKIYQEEKTRAYKDATWDEERITNLMKTTIDSYITEKKKQKPVPKAFIPANPTYPQYSPQQQQQQNYYPNPAQQQYQHQQQQQQQQQRIPHYQQKPPKRAKDPLADLFGYNGENNM